MDTCHRQSDDPGDAGQPCDYARFFRRRYGAGRWRPRRSLRVVERLERDFHRAGRILVPNLTDWTQTGKVLALLAAKHGFEQIGKGRLTNDALIAMSAGRLGITVITANARDFAKLAEFRPFHWRVENPAAN